MKQKIAEKKRFWYTEVVSILMIESFKVIEVVIKQTNNKKIWSIIYHPIHIKLYKRGVQLLHRCNSLRYILWFREANDVSHNKHICWSRIVSVAGKTLQDNICCFLLEVVEGRGVCEAASIFSSALSCPSVCFHISLQ